jgi:predicted GNAT family N-acyltransferase
MHRPHPDRSFTVHQLAPGDDRAAAYDVRRRVFQEEQGVPPEEEFDADDERAIHVVALAGSEAIGTARLVVYPDYAKIGRMAVLKPWRRCGVGRAMLEHLARVAASHGATRILLHSQVQAIPFYAALGFTVAGAEFEEAGIPHRPMQRPVKRSDSARTRGRKGNP